MPPEKPLPMDCCGSGCPMCVLDIYDAALARYETELAAWEARQRERKVRGQLPRIEPMPGKDASPCRLG